MIAYLQVNESNIITDAITYPYENYIPVEVTELPAGVNGGWFKLENGIIVEHLELKPPTPDDRISALEAQNAQMLLALVQGGLM